MSLPAHKNSIKSKSNASNLNWIDTLDGILDGDPDLDLKLDDIKSKEMLIPIKTPAMENSASNTTHTQNTTVYL